MQLKILIFSTFRIPSLIWKTIYYIASYWNKWIIASIGNWRSAIHDYDEPGSSQFEGSICDKAIIAMDMLRWHPIAIFTNFDRPAAFAMKRWLSFTIAGWCTTITMKMVPDPRSIHCKCLLEKFHLRWTSQVRNGMFRWQWNNDESRNFVVAIRWKLPIYDYFAVARPFAMPTTGKYELEMKASFKGEST